MSWGCVKWWVICSPSRLLFQKSSASAIVTTHLLINLAVKINWNKLSSWITLNTSSSFIVLLRSVIVSLYFTLKFFRWAAQLVLWRLKKRLEKKIHIILCSQLSLLFCLYYLCCCFNLWVSISRWQGLNFNRLLLLELHRNEKRCHLRRTVTVRVEIYVGACVRSVRLHWVNVFLRPTQACQRKLYMLR